MKGSRLTTAIAARTGSFVAGVGALVSIWPPSTPPQYPKRTEMQALRSDALRIGDDMRRVIDREYGRLKTSER